VNPERSLAWRERAFARAYVESLDASYSAQVAGARSEYAAAVGARLLSSVRVRRLIAKYLRKQVPDWRFLAHQLVAELKAIAFSDIGLVVGWDADGRIRYNRSSDLGSVRKAISSVTVRTLGKGGSKISQVKMHDKGRAMRLLAQVCGILARAESDERVVGASRPVSGGPGWSSRPPGVCIIVEQLPAAGGGDGGGGSSVVGGGSGGSSVGRGGPDLDAGKAVRLVESVEVPAEESGPEGVVEGEFKKDVSAKSEFDERSGSTSKVEAGAKGKVKVGGGVKSGGKSGVKSRRKSRRSKSGLGREVVSGSVVESASWGSVPAGPVRVDSVVSGSGNGGGSGLSSSVKSALVERLRSRRGCSSTA